MSTQATISKAIVNVSSIEVCTRQYSVRGRNRLQISCSITGKTSRQLNGVHAGSGSFRATSGHKEARGVEKAASSFWTPQDQHRWRTRANPDGSYSSRYSPRAPFRGTPSSRKSANRSPRNASDVSQLHETTSSESGDSARASTQTRGASTHSPLPEIRPSAEQVLRKAILEVVPALQEAPFLHIEYKHNNRRERVPDSMVSAPQLWHGIAESLGQEDPKTIVFVRRVERNPSPSAGVPCPRDIAAASSLSAPPSSRGLDPLSASLTSTSKPDSAASSVAPPDQTQQDILPTPRRDPEVITTSPKMESASPKPEAKLSAKSLSGQVGDCCIPRDAHTGESTGEEQGTASPTQLPPNNRPNTHKQGKGLRECSCSGPKSLSARMPDHHQVEVVDVDPKAPFGHGTECECNTARGDALDVWGVVVQSKECPVADGCYILTTCRAETGTGCCCTRFALQRASCGGASIAQQMDNMWLS